MHCFLSTFRTIVAFLLILSSMLQTGVKAFLLRPDVVACSSSFSVGSTIPRSGNSCSSRRRVDQRSRSRSRSIQLLQQQRQSQVPASFFPKQNVIETSVVVCRQCAVRTTDTDTDKQQEDNDDDGKNNNTPSVLQQQKQHFLPLPHIHRLVTFVFLLTCNMMVFVFDPFAVQMDSAGTTAAYALSARDKQDILEVLEPKFDAIDQKFDRKFDAIDRKFDAIDRKFEKIDNKMDLMDKKMDLMDKKFENMDKKMDLMDKKFENMDNKMDLMDKKMDLTDKKIELAVIWAGVITAFIGIASATYVTVEGGKKVDAALQTFTEKEESIKNGVSWKSSLAGGGVATLFLLAFVQVFGRNQFTF